MSGRIVAVGECMVELAPTEGGLYRRGFAGDSFNFAWYIRRALPPAFSVEYVSAVGADTISDEMLAFMAASGIGTDAVRRVPDRTVGLYMIALKNGERSFSYWRSHSAARLLAQDRAALDAAFDGARLVLVTGISVAVVEAGERGNLLAALEAARAAGTTIAFDPNVRPRLWPNAATMRGEIQRTAATADIVLPSFDDEAAYFGDADPAATVERYRGLGATTVVVKNGGGEVLGWSAAEGEARVQPAPLEVVDSTAAGDCFNAGFLAATLTGAPLAAAIAAGAGLAGAKVGARGALVETAAA